MFKANNETVAHQIAKEEGLCYGWTVLGGGWYVGTAEQLNDIGVIAPRACIKVTRPTSAAPTAEQIQKAFPPTN